MEQKTLIGVLGCPIRENKQNQIEFFLTQRYAPKNLQYHLKWQLAGGGLEFGETPEQTLLREFKEELNLTPEIIYPYPVVKTTIREYSNRHFHLILLSYIITIGDQLPEIIDPDQETSDMGWFTFAQIQELDNIENNLFFINEIEKIVKQNFIVFSQKLK